MIDKDSKKLFCVETFFKKKHNELTALPKLAPYIYDICISGFTRSIIYIRRLLTRG